MRKHVLLYGLLCGVLIAALQLIEYRWLVVAHSAEIYGGLVASVFASLGIWLGLRLTRRTETVVVHEVESGDAWGMGPQVESAVLNHGELPCERSC